MKPPFLIGAVVASAIPVAMAAATKPVEFLVRTRVESGRHWILEVFITCLIAIGDRPIF